MARIYIGLGSNIERDHYLLSGLQALAQHFDALHYSTVYESAAVGFVGSNFYNLVAGADTELDIERVQARLREIEFAHGRTPDARKFSPRTLDLDLLTYDQWVVSEPVVLPRAEILTNAFVLRPFAELAPDYVHPVVGQTLAQLWQSYDASLQPLTPVSLAVTAEARGG